MALKESCTAICPAMPLFPGHYIPSSALLLILLCFLSDPGDWGNLMMEWRPFMVATGKHGLIEGEVTPRKGINDDIVSSATSESSYRVCLLPIFVQGQS